MIRIWWRHGLVSITLLLLVAGVEPAPSSASPGTSDDHYHHRGPSSLIDNGYGLTSDSQAKANQTARIGLVGGERLGEGDGVVAIEMVVRDEKVTLNAPLDQRPSYIAQV